FALTNDISTSGAANINLMGPMITASLGGLTLGTETQLAINARELDANLTFTGATNIAQDAAIKPALSLTATLTGAAVGNANLTMDGAGALVTMSPSSRSGQTIAADGTLVVGANGTSSGLGTGNLVVQGGAVDLTLVPGGTDPVTLANNVNVMSPGSQINSTGITVTTFANLSVVDSAELLLTSDAVADFIFAGGTTLTGNATISPEGDASAELRGVVSGDALTKAGSGELLLSNANTYTGVTTIADGQLTASNNAALGTNAAGTVSLAGSALGLVGGVTLDAAETLVLAGDLLSISGANILNQNVTFNEGTPVVSTLAGSLTINGDLDITNTALTLGGDGDITVNGDIVGTITATPLVATNPNLELWLDAGDLTGADGSDVTMWSDKSTDFNNSVINHAANINPPTLVSNGLGGMPVVRFNGTTDYLYAPDETQFDFASEMTIFMVGEAKAGTGTWEGVITKRGEGDGWQLRRHGGDDHVVLTLRGTSADDDGHSGGPAADAPLLNTPQIFTARYDSSLRQTWLGGTLSTNLVDTGDIANSGSALVLGARDNSGDALNAPDIGNHAEVDMSEVLIFNSALTELERLVVEDFLGQKYNLAHLPVNLYAGIRKTGVGTVTLAGNNSYTGETNVEAGRLNVTSTTGIATGAVLVENGATLGGDGGVLASIDVEAGAKLAPGDVTGQLSTGNTTIPAGGTLEIEIAGTNAGEFGSLDVTGTVDVTGSNLVVQLNGGFVPTVGDTMVIVDNDQADAVVGTFAGLADDAELVVSVGQSSIRFQISYNYDSVAGVDGNGNDIALIRVNGFPAVASVAINTGFVDPAPLAKGPSPTSWAQQRSTIERVTIEFTEDVNATVANFTLTNLGIDIPVDSDTPFTLQPQHFSLVGSTVTLDFAAAELGEGAYRLDIAGNITDLAGNGFDGDNNGNAGGVYSFGGARDDEFYVLITDWSGDAGISVFDFSTFSYWFGEFTTRAPTYADPSRDNGVSVFDFTLFADRFGDRIQYPAGFAAGSSDSLAVAFDDAQEQLGLEQDQVNDQADILVRWTKDAGPQREQPTLLSENGTEFVDELMGSLNVGDFDLFDL
ncbi:MAG: autotransporter-associated beta strand protein, partial [Pirellulaceae bacterium]